MPWVIDQSIKTCHWLESECKQRIKAIKDKRARIKIKRNRKKISRSPSENYKIVLIAWLKNIKSGIIIRATNKPIKITNKQTIKKNGKVKEIKEMINIIFQLYIW